MKDKTRGPNRSLPRLMTPPNSIHSPIKYMLSIYIYMYIYHIYIYEKKGSKYLLLGGGVVGAIILRKGLCWNT